MTEHRFQAVDLLEAAVARASRARPRWEIRGADAVLCVEPAAGVRVEAVPLGERVRVRVEAELDPGDVARWVERLRDPPPALREPARSLSVARIVTSVSA